VVVVDEEATRGDGKEEEEVVRIWADEGRGEAEEGGLVGVVVGTETCLSDPDS